MDHNSRLHTAFSRKWVRKFLILVAFCGVFLWGLVKIGSVCPAALELAAARMIGM